MFEEQGGGGDGGITLTTKGGHTITISDTDKGITVASKHHTLHLDDQGRAVTIESGGDVEISGSGGKLTIGTQGVELVSSAALKVQAGATLDVVSNAVLSIQGTLVKIN